MENFEEKYNYILKECERLKSENHRLKGLLKRHNIQIGNNPYHSNIVQNSRENRIKERIDIFTSLFKGRMDVYAVRWESKNGKAGYSPACGNEWNPTLCNKPKIKCADCLNKSFLSVTDQVIYDHLSGNKTIGIYPLLKDETCWFLAVDFDKKSWKEDAKAFVDACKDFSIPASIERSRSGNGCHIWIFFANPIPSPLARKLGNILLTRTLEKDTRLGLIPMIGCFLTKILFQQVDSVT